MTCFRRTAMMHVSPIPSSSSSSSSFPFSLIDGDRFVHIIIIIDFFVRPIIISFVARTNEAHSRKEDMHDPVARSMHTM